MSKYSKKFKLEVISYNLSRHPVFAQVVDMLEKAFNKIPDNTNLILHSDQGWQYQMKKYQYLLKEKGIRQSMSRKGNCIDYYNNKRIKSKLKGMSPVQHRTHFQRVA